MSIDLETDRYTKQLSTRTQHRIHALDKSREIKFLLNYCISSISVLTMGVIFKSVSINMSELGWAKTHRCVENTSLVRFFTIVELKLSKV